MPNAICCNKFPKIRLIQIIGADTCNVGLLCNCICHDHKIVLLLAALRKTVELGV